LALQSTRVRTRTPRCTPDWANACASFDATPRNIVRRGSLRGSVQFALLGPMKVNAAIRLRSLWQIRPWCTLSSIRRNSGSKPRLSIVRVATPLSALDAYPPRHSVSRALDELSPQPYRPLTSHVAPRHQRVGSNVLRPPASALHASRNAPSRFYLQSQGRPTVPPQREGNPPYWREDGGTTQNACHRASFPASLR